MVPFHVTDGFHPQAGLIADSAGNLYGTTRQGGTGDCPLLDLKGCGVVFKLSPGRIETVLYSFTGGSDGASPQAGLIADGTGNLYGTTTDGGTLQFCGGGCGVVFKLSPPAPPKTQWTETVLHSFCSATSCQGGALPLAGLIADSAGNLYGTTLGGGTSVGGAACGGCGVVFQLSPPVPPATRWTYRVLYFFCSKPGCSDGGFPHAGVVADSAGNLYGTTGGGGAGDCTLLDLKGCGVVFKLSPPVPPATRWTETVLYTFTGGGDGANPTAGLLVGSDGNLYGTTLAGGTYNYGVVFKLSP